MSQNEDNLHHPEPEQPDSGPELKKRPGHHTSSLWDLFTEDVDPQSQTCSTCHNCYQSVVYHKKSERVKDHLIKCPMFNKAMMEMDEDSHPLWFNEVLSNKKLKSRQSSSSGQLYPNLREVAINMFSMATSSAASENGFSAMGFDHSKRRNQLAAKSRNWFLSRTMHHS